MDKYFMHFEEQEVPKYVQVFKHIKKLIDINAIKDGEKLPSIRELSKLLSVNTVTIVNVYKKLQSEGYTIQKMGSGTYAKRRDTIRSQRNEYSDFLKKLPLDLLKEYIDFTGETTCSDLFPVDTFKNVLNEVLDRDGSAAFIYQEMLGYRGLRESINKFFWNNSLDNENILIVSGAQQGIDIASKAMINVNDNVIVEKPTYGGALSVFRGRKANIFEVDMLQDGVDIDKFEKILKKNKIKCFYAMSYFQNPTGATYSLEKKIELLRLAEKYDFYIIEDDYLSELIYDTNIEYKSFKALDINDRVVYIKSFSKIFLPGIRIGYILPPLFFLENIQNHKMNTDISTSSLMQRALDLYINKGLWKEHIIKLNTLYKHTYTFMEYNINNILGDKVSFISPRGGFNFYLKISDKISINSMELFHECKNDKVLVTPGMLFYRHPRDGEKFFRIGFSQVTEDKILHGMQVINENLSVGVVRASSKK